MAGHDGRTLRLPRSPDRSDLLLRLHALLTLLLLLGAGCTATSPPPATPTPTDVVGTVTADDPAFLASPVGPSTVTTTTLAGNRTTSGRLDLGPDPVALDAGFVPTALLAAPLRDGQLLVATDRVQSRSWVLRPDGTVTAGPDLAEPGAGRPALVRDGDDWQFAPSRQLGDGDWTVEAGALRRDDDAVTFGAATVTDLLPDARYAVNGNRLAVPVAPTDVYRHAVLGDDVEAGALAVADARSGEMVVHDLPDGLVLEGTGALLADVDGDGTADPVVTLSGPAAGARQAVLLDDRFVLGPAIGQGNRWRHLVGVQDGTLFEIVTPHLARVFQTLRLDDVALVVGISQPETVASHAIGSRDLDQAALVDATGDGIVDLVGPASDDDRTLLVVDGTDGSEVARRRLPGVQSSNLLGIARDDGRALAALGTSDGVVVVYGLGG